MPCNIIFVTNVLWTLSWNVCYWCDFRVLHSIVGMCTVYAIQHHIYGRYLKMFRTMYPIGVSFGYCIQMFRWRGKFSRNDEISLPFTDVVKSCSYRECLTSQTYLLTLFAKIKFSHKYLQNLDPVVPNTTFRNNLYCHIVEFALVDFLHLSQQFFIHVGTCHGLNLFFAENKISCSMTQHSASGEARSSDPSISSQALITLWHFTRVYPVC